ncbi:hypothetical protein IC582_006825 [Cucumis melo]
MDLKRVVLNGNGNGNGKNGRTQLSHPPLHTHFLTILANFIKKQLGSSVQITISMPSELKSSSFIILNTTWTLQDSFISLHGIYFLIFDFPSRLNYNFSFGLNYKRCFKSLLYASKLLKNFQSLKKISLTLKMIQYLIRKR